ncbi:MAG: hypothetical protein MZV63_53505 [Marinilabiliales bacterium]|nr:hypothetical protein [Marinilabiliales bacterium]
MVSPLRDKGKLAGSFGSYGWSGEAPGLIAEMLKNLKLRFFEEPAAFKFVPESDKEKDACRIRRAVCTRADGRQADA